MPTLTLDDRNALYYEHHAPARQGAPTFVFVNALTGATGHWEAHVAPALRAAGFGTLCYNFRGQEGSSFDPAVELTPGSIVEDLRRLLDALRPPRAVLVGLSIGGLFAARAVLEGAEADALVLLNTLRVIGPRLAWVNDALPHYVALGGTDLFIGAMLPLLVNEEFAASARPKYLKGNYQPLDPRHGHMNLMRNSVLADWDLPYEALALPTLVITGHQDRVFRDAAVIDRLYARLPDARREEWPDAGHLLPQERPEKLAASLAGFGRAVEARPA